MPTDSDKNLIRCAGCRKVIGEGILNDGKISLKCKCGVINIIEARPEVKPTNFIHNQPYQNRLNLVTK